ARGAVARQAEGPVEQRRLAEVQMAAAGREGGPHRHARSAGHRRAAPVLRRCHQVQPAAPGCRQDLRGGRHPGCEDVHRGRRGRGGGATPGARPHAGAPGRSPAALHRRAAPDAADAQRPEEGRQAAVRVRARRRGSGARGARRHGPRVDPGRLPRPVGPARHPAGGEGHQGHLHPDAGRGHRRGARMRRAPVGPAPPGDRPVRAGPVRHAGRPRSHARRRARVAAAGARGAAGRPHACHARRPQCRPVPVRPAPARRLGRPGPRRRVRREPCRLAGHRPRQGRRTDSG
ncbi:MAG: tRNA pseudouridine(55) synthase, partial [uncultured Ramlibacter sp.]